MEIRYALGTFVIVFFLLPIWSYMMVNVIVAAFYEAKYSKHMKYVKIRRNTTLE